MVSGSGPLPRSFYARPTVTVARALLGARLVRIIDGRRLAGVITETEAYVGTQDLGCHAKAGVTPRTRVMFGPPGRAYVYFTYGNHWMLCVVTERAGFPAAVLIRAFHPTEGAHEVARRRGGRDTSGPGKLTQALGIAREQNDTDMTSRDAGLWIERGWRVSKSSTVVGPRVGLNNVPEPWKSMPWRFRARAWSAAPSRVSEKSGRPVQL